MTQPHEPAGFSDRLAQLFAKLELDDLEDTRRRALGWTVLCIDTDEEPWACPFAYGIHPTPEDALIAAIRMDENDKKWNDEGWAHMIVPILPD